jgi:hypothetical protein
MGVTTIEWTSTPRPDGTLASGGAPRKTCSKCKTPKDREDFAVFKKAPDGLSYWCKDCQRDYMRGRPSDPEKRRQNAKASDQRHPDRRRAREKVKDAIRRGDLSRAKETVCKDCSRPATAYDHYLGYDYPLEVEPVCHECHGKRSRVRGEHKKAAGRLLDGVLHDGYPTSRKEAAR